MILTPQNFQKVAHWESGLFFFSQMLIKLNSLVNRDIGKKSFRDGMESLSFHLPAINLVAISCFEAV